MTNSLDRVTEALAAWKSADEKLSRAQEEAHASVAGNAMPGIVVSEWTTRLAGLRADRERAYRAALAAMQAHHDQTGRVAS